MSRAISANKREKRSRRLLAMLTVQKAVLETCSTPEIFVLNFEGTRKVKVPRELVALWLQHQWVRASVDENRRQVLRITTNGRRFLGRPGLSNMADQHRKNITELIMIDGDRQQVTRNIKESPLAALFRTGASTRKNWLCDEEFAAGERLRADFECAQLSPRITASWDPTSNLGSKGGGRRPDDHVSDRVIAAKARLNKALDAVGPELSGILLDICCFLKGIEQVERERNWPKRSAKLLLKAGLSALARHYTPTNSRRSENNLRQWGSGDYRPTISGQT